MPHAIIMSSLFLFYLYIFFWLTYFLRKLISRQITVISNEIYFGQGGANQVYIQFNLELMSAILNSSKYRPCHPSAINGGQGQTRCFQQTNSRLQTLMMLNFNCRISQFHIVFIRTSYTTCELYVYVGEGGKRDVVEREYDST